ncbi:hypothetical protein SAMD00020551_4084 [Mesobacillus selenatarsenatis SF-1]|uniref:Uncharacterized protein n=1 Tax=Mesobacillus selenatarsenatis (strain DSM 18680 / JCM 14380 / FERM P-15431 / SF-1) TaxID=1321606 RepID=A0A0A8X7P6_MESS1|nr:hypothetical protein SAMD00020551_4084 [Mesobacillus selenatarsenatis SF-1]
MLFLWRIGDQKIKLLEKEITNKVYWSTYQSSLQQPSSLIQVHSPKPKP